MSSSPLRLLIIEDSLTDAKVVEGELRRSSFGPVEARRVSSLAAGLAELNSNDFDALLLDLLLPDASDLDAVRAVHAAHPDLPIVVISSIQDPRVAVASIRDGAQDYVMKAHLDGDVLALSLRLAVERRRRESDLLAGRAE